MVSVSLTKKYHYFRHYPNSTTNTCCFGGAGSLCPADDQCSGTLPGGATDCDAGWCASQRRALLTRLSSF